MVLATSAVGLGKTELLNAFTERAARSGAVVLTATGSHAETALAFSIMTQLFADPGLPDDIVARAGVLLDEALFSAIPDEQGSMIQRGTHARVVHGLCSTLLDLAKERPVVIAVDDAHFADGPSLQALLYLARRLRAARVLMVLTESESGCRADPTLHAELSRHSHYRRIRIDPLTVKGVARVLDTEFGESTGPGLAEAYHYVSGGNPLILHALIEDRHAVWAAGEIAPEPVTGEAFERAVLACLHRTGTWTSEFARGLAVLGEETTPALLGRLLDIRPSSAALYLDMLEMTGLVEQGRFRHPAAGSAVLATATPEERVDLHLRVAGLLRDAGVVSASIVNHLLAAGEAKGDWAVSMLKVVAEQALREDELTRAAACLELARRACADESRAAEIILLQAVVEWRTNPAAAAGHVGLLREAASQGRLAGRHIAVLAKYQLWYGRPGDAEEVLASLNTNGEENLQAEIDLQIARQLLQYSTNPKAAKGNNVMAGTGDLADRLRRSAAGSLAAALDGENSGGSPEHTIREAEQVLRTWRLSDASFEPIACALLALVYADRADLAETPCRTLLDEATRRGAKTWEALLTAILAEICLRRSDLRAAEELAVSALKSVPAQGWGVVLGSPLSTLMLARTAMGKFDEAATLLDQVVPDAMLQTRFGVQYLYARGRYYLAIGCPHAALADFGACRELMRRGRIDVPALVPWRTGIAEAMLELGRPAEARELLDEQLALAGPRSSRTRGVTLRLLAKASELKQRPRLIRQAVDVLQDCGDQFELAFALAELSRTHHALGEYGRSRMMAQRALALADGSTAHLFAGLLPDAVTRPEKQEEPELEAAGGDEAKAEGFAGLSEAERRVAELAAVGHTNREIGRKLFITVSTVEQHLTRVYRKLKVTRRTDLVVQLPMRVADSV